MPLEIGSRLSLGIPLKLAIQRRDSSSVEDVIERVGCSLLIFPLAHRPFGCSDARSLKLEQSMSANVRASKPMTLTRQMFTTANMLNSRVIGILLAALVTASPFCLPRFPVITIEPRDTCGKGGNSKSVKTALCNSCPLLMTAYLVTLAMQSIRQQDNKASRMRIFKEFEEFKG